MATLNTVTLEGKTAYTHTEMLTTLEGEEWTDPDANP